MDKKESPQERIKRLKEERNALKKQIHQTKSELKQEINEVPEIPHEENENEIENNQQQIQQYEINNNNSNNQEIEQQNIQDDLKNIQQPNKQSDDFSIEDFQAVESSNSQVISQQVSSNFLLYETRPENNSQSQQDSHQQLENEKLMFNLYKSDESSSPEKNQEIKQKYVDNQEKVFVDENNIPINQKQIMQRIKKQYAGKNRSPNQNPQQKQQENHMQDSKNSQKFHQKCKQNDQFQIKPKSNLTQKEKEEVWKRLLADKEKKIEEKRQFQKKIKEQEINQLCTFKPEINSPSKLNSDNFDENLPVEQRLIQEGERYRDKIEILQEEKNEKEGNFPFQPQINENNPYINHQQQPIGERVHDLAKQKQQNLENLKAFYDKQYHQEINCGPLTNQISQILTQNQRKNVFDRLQDQAELLDQKKQVSAMLIQEEMDKECVFQPNSMNKLLSTNIFSNSAYSDQGFFERQQIYMQQSKDIQQQLQEEAKYTFKPEINKNSQSILSGNMDRLSETQQDKVRRLYEEDSNKRLANQKVNEFQEQLKYSFSPRINENSKKLMINRVRSIDDLAYNQQGKVHIEMMRNEIEDQRWLAEGASFYPAPYSQNIDKFEVIPSRYKNKQKINPRNHEDTNLMGNIKIEQKVKRQQYLEKLKQKVREEEKKHPFNPQIKSNTNIKAQKNSKLHVINGLEQFMDNRINGYQLQKEKAIAAEKMLNLHIQYDRKDHTSPTKAQPFPLSQSKSHKSYQKENNQNQIYSIENKINKKYGNRLKNQ